MYDSVGTVRGALAVLGITLGGNRAGTHPLPIFNRFKRGLFNVRPSFPSYAGAGDVLPMLRRR